MFQKNRSTPMKPNYRNIVQKGDEIYLCVNGEWFFYNQTEPPLGAGAMGTVYLGRSCQTQERVQLSAWWINMPMYQAFVKEPN